MYVYGVVLIDLMYILKLVPKQLYLFRWFLLNRVKGKLHSVKRKFCAVNTKCGAAKIYGLCPELSNS